MIQHLKSLLLAKLSYRIVIGLYLCLIILTMKEEINIKSNMKEKINRICGEKFKILIG